MTPLGSQGLPFSEADRRSPRQAAGQAARRSVRGSARGFLPAGRKGGSGEGCAGFPAGSGSVATSSESSAITITADIICLVLPAPVKERRRLKNVPVVSLNATKRGFVAGTFGFANVVSVREPRKKMQIPHQCKLSLAKNASSKSPRSQD